MAYIYGERKQFTTLGELRKLTENLADIQLLSSADRARQASFT